jgi:hypothetical protein
MYEVTCIFGLGASKLSICLIILISYCLTGDKLVYLINDAIILGFQGETQSHVVIFLSTVLQFSYRSA